MIACYQHFLDKSLHTLYSLRCEYTLRSQYARIPDLNISPFKMANCTLIIGVYFLNTNGNGFMMNNADGEWDRGILLNYDKGMKPSLGRCLQKGW